MGIGKHVATAALIIFGLDSAHGIQKPVALTNTQQQNVSWWRGFFTTAPATGPSLKAQRALGQRLIRSETREDQNAVSHLFGHSRGASVSTDVLDGEIRLVMAAMPYQLSSPAAHATHARAVLRDLGARDVEMQWNQAGSESIGSVTSVRYDRTVNGLPVEGAYLMLRYRKGNLIQVTNELFTQAEVAPAAFSLTQERAQEIIASDSGIVPTQLTRLYRVERVGSMYTLVPSYRAEVSVSEPDGQWIYTVNAQTGDVLEIKNRNLFHSGKISGMVLPRTVTDTVVKRAFFNHLVQKGQQKLYTNADGSFEGTNVNGNYALTMNSKYFGITNKLRNGRNANVSLPETSSEIADFLWSDSNSNLAERNVLYHLEVVRNWAANTYAEFGKTYSWLNAPFKANVNLNQVCNAYYDGTSVNFFIAGKIQNIECNNTGLIADVSYHEWGHGLDDKVAGGIDDRPFSEGIGDIASMIQTWSPTLAPYFMTNGEPVRDIEPPFSYPEDAGEEHDEGRIIGATYWSLMNDLASIHGLEKARKIISRYFLASILSSVKYKDNYAALIAVDEDVHTMSGTASSFCVINRAFAKHGLTQVDDRCLTQVALSSYTLDPAIPTAGSTVNVTATLKNPTEQTLTNVSTELNARTEGLEISQASQTVTLDAGEEVALAPISVTFPEDAKCNSSYKTTLVRKTANNIDLSLIDLIVGKSGELLSQVESGVLNTNIPDGSTTGLTSELIVTDEHAFVSNLFHVTVAIKHNNRADMRIAIVAPSKKSSFVFYHLDRGQKDLRKTFRVKDMARVSASGAWKLKVVDDSFGDKGVLESWSLSIPTYTSACM